MLDVDIRRSLSRFIVGEISIEEFEDWFVAATWEVEKSGNINAIDLAREVDLRLAEFSNGHWSVDELRRKFRPFVETYSVELSIGTASTLYSPGTSARTVQNQSVGILAGAERG